MAVPSYRKYDERHFPIKHPGRPGTHKRKARCELGANADCSCTGKCLARHFNKPPATFSMCGRWAPGGRSFHGINMIEFSIKLKLSYKQFAQLVVLLLMLFR